MQLLSQIAATAPEDASNWLRLARTVLQFRPSDDRERTTLLERGVHCRLHRLSAHVEPQRGGGRAAASRAAPSRTASCGGPRSTTMRLSLELRESGRIARQLRAAARGARLPGCSTTPSTPIPRRPRACFQFSETLPGRRTDFSPFVSVAGQDKPALSADDKQALRRGPQARRPLQHHAAQRPAVDREGEPVEIGRVQHLRARPQAVRALHRPRLRAAAHRPAGHPGGQRQQRRRSTCRSGASADRNLLETVLGRDFQTNLDRYDIDRLANRNGIPVWKGELKVENQLNAEISTAFPVDQAVGDLAPGVYVMSAEPAGGKSERDFESLATQWFIGLRPRARGLYRQRRRQRLRPFAGHDRRQAADRAAADRPQQRGARHQAHRRGRPRHFRGGARARRGRTGARAGRRPPIRRATTHSSA